MAAIVNIDQPLTQLSLAAGDRRSLSFDLVNVAERSLHVTVTTTPEPGKGDAVPAWVALAGEPTFRLGPKETKKVELEVAPPAGTAPTGIGFRLKVFEVSLPEENNSFSEPVQVTVAAAAPTEPGRKPPWKLLGAIAAAILLLVVAGGGWYAWQHVARTTLPDVEGETLAEAITLLEEAGIPRASIVEERPIAADADDRVTRQDPEPGSTIEPGLRVTLTVPRQPAQLTLPRLPEGATAGVAEATYGALGLAVAISEDAAAAGKVPGLVVAVQPEPGSPILEGETATVRVLSQTVEVPNLRGAVLTPAMRSQLEANFVLQATAVEDRNRETGFVLAQPHHGNLARGSEVVLVTTYIPGTIGGFTAQFPVEQLMEINPLMRRQIEEQVQEFRPNLQLFQPQR